MLKTRKIGRWALVAGAAGAVVFAVGALTAPAAAGTMCPYIVAPVKCSDGKVYINGCFAAKAHATGCVPYFP